MREILFRAKEINSGEWMHGGVAVHGNTYDVNPPFCTCTEVQQETIGQYTGLVDKNGKKIFEGDIVRHYNIDELPEEFEIGKIFFSEEQCCFKRTCNTGFSSCYISADCKYEVIGNIHDNPGLLEVKD